MQLLNSGVEASHLFSSDFIELYVWGIYFWILYFGFIAKVGAALRDTTRHRGCFFANSCLLNGATYSVWAILCIRSLWVTERFSNKYSGAIIRTTHLTGIFTDLGIQLGAVLRGEAFDKRKSILFLLIIIGFTCGGLIGYILFNKFEFFALTFPAGICFLLAVTYRFYSARAVK